MSIAEKLLAEKLPIDELIARAVKQAKYADQSIDSETAELTFNDRSSLLVTVSLVDPPLYELRFFSGATYDDSYSNALESGAVYSSGFTGTFAGLCEIKEQLIRLQAVIDSAENCINGNQSGLVHVFVNMADPLDMFHFHDVV